MSFLAAFFELPVAQQQRVAELMNGHLKRNPKQMNPPLLKQLKGAHSHLRQFECGGPRRLLYEVDDAAMKVTIVYLGGHPEWEKRGKVRL